MNDFGAIKQQVWDWVADAKANPIFPRVMLGGIVIAIIDQISKHIIVDIVKLPDRLTECAKIPNQTCAQIAVSPIFDLTYVRNFGASFGMLTGGLGSRILLSAISISIVVALAAWAGRMRKPIPATGIAFIIGGAIGNLYDRITLGYVVDFLDFSGLNFPWVFNVADAAINVGVGLLLLDAFLESRETKTSG